MDETKKIIIDGYNLIHRIPDLKQYMQSYAENAREHLLLKLENYQNIQERDVDILVVFDSHKSPDHPGEKRQTNGKIKILYTASGEQADEAILRELHRHSSPKDWLVVTSDYWDINSFVIAKGGNYISSEKFAGILEAATQSLLQKSSNQDNRDFGSWSGNSVASFKVYKSWVAINCTFPLVSIYILAKGHFEIITGSEPDGFKLDRNGNAITIINLNGQLESQDILFEFAGALTITRVEVIDENGDHQEARLHTFIQ